MPASRRDQRVKCPGEWGGVFCVVAGPPKAQNSVDEKSMPLDAEEKPHKAAAFAECAAIPA